MKTVAIIGTFDTKGEEFAYVKARFERLAAERGIKAQTEAFKAIRK